MVYTLPAIVAIVTIPAVDRPSRVLKAESAEASEEVRMLKTVARIAPQFDLGQEE